MLTQHIQESLQVTPGPIPNFWVGPGDEAISATSFNGHQTPFPCERVGSLHNPD